MVRNINTEYTELFIVQPDLTWEQRKLYELGHIMTGSTPSSAHNEFYSDDGIPWVTPTDITSNLIIDTPKKLSEEGEKVGRVVPANTILVTCIASIGKNALSKVKGSFNQQINSLTPNNENGPYFLLSESELWSLKMKRQAAAATMQIVNKAGIPVISIHGLRHTYAVMASKSGDDIKTVQENLGHATAAFTLDVYSHVTAQMHRDSADRMEQVIRDLSQGIS